VKSVLALLGALFALLLSPLAMAQSSFPNRPITIVVGYPPGGGADAIGRLVAQQLGERLGQSVVIDNRPGFSGNIGAAHVAKSNADGYTLLLAPWTTYGINSILYGSKVGYSLEADFAPISSIGYQPMLLLVPASLPVRSVAELVALAKEKPDALSFGSTGPGSLEHISGEMLKRQAGIEMVHVAYRGNGPAITDLMSGQIQLLFVTAPTWAANKDGDRLRALMVTTPRRNPAFPELPTPREAGVEGFEVQSTYGLLAPAKTPEAVLGRLNEALGQVLQDEQVRLKFRQMGLDAVGSTRDELGRYVKADMQKWADVIKSQGIKAE